MKKYVQQMWMIHDTLFINKEDALNIEDGKETVKKVYVGVDAGIDLDLQQESSDFFGRWIFQTESEAQQEVNEFNQ
ncbi:hypothetical protein [Bacillus ndiopicus]|uniref:hypothetical protein n=1 Tax=Bacillus ndiopicus TaxID=1347368 RepID=UPI0005A5D294|nr:hypothetical protein [Bacillus ndiopicus]